MACSGRLPAALRLLARATGAGRSTHEIDQVRDPLSSPEMGWRLL